MYLFYDLAVKLLTSIQSSLHGIEDDQYYLFEVAEFCAALSDMNPNEMEVIGNSSNTIVTTGLSDGVRVEILKLFRSVLTHPVASSLNELRVEPMGSLQRKIFLEEGCVVHCMGKPMERSSSSSSEEEAVVETVALSVVRPPPPASAASAVGTEGGDGGGGGSGRRHSLKMALETMKSTHDTKTYATGVGTLIKILDNIISNANVRTSYEIHDIWSV